MRLDALESTGVRFLLPRNTGPVSVFWSRQTPEKRLLRASTLVDTVYYRADFDSDPCRITVPNLTRKERIYLDREMPGTEGWTPKEFDLGPDETQRYREIYRFLPAFAEILL